jgi:hypothetical protein
VIGSFTRESPESDEPTFRRVLADFEPNLRFESFSHFKDPNVESKRMWYFEGKIIGSARKLSSGRLAALDKAGKILAVYDPKRKATFFPNRRRMGAGDQLETVILRSNAVLKGNGNNSGQRRLRQVTVSTKRFHTIPELLSDFQFEKFVPPSWSDFVERRRELLKLREELTGLSDALDASPDFGARLESILKRPEAMRSITELLHATEKAQAEDVPVSAASENIAHAPDSPTPKHQPHLLQSRRHSRPDL